MKKKVVIFTAPEGHLSIAQAAQQALEKKYETHLYFERDPLFNLYVPWIQYFPSLHRIPFKLSTYKQAKKILSETFKVRYQNKVQAAYTKYAPDVCISTYFMFNSSLELLKKNTVTHFVNILPDPKTINPLYVSEIADNNLFFDQAAIASVNSLTEEYPVKMMPSGWFVRDQFEKKYNQQNVRKKLALAAQTFTLLVASGSEGTAMVMKILPMILTIPTKIQVVIACGNNTALRRGVKLLQQLAKKTNNSSKIIPLGFSENMEEYMQAADIVVGKAGPNTLFETVATRTPFFAITHIAGQEDGNLDIIRDYNLGYVEENPLKAQKLLSDIIENPEQLKKFDVDLKKMAEYNRGAKKKLLKLVEQLLKTREG